MCGIVTPMIVANPPLLKIGNKNHCSMALLYVFIPNLGLESGKQGVGIWNLELGARIELGGMK